MDNAECTDMFYSTNVHMYFSSYYLQREVDKVCDLKSVKNLQFRTLAKIQLHNLLAGQQFVFLDCNCLPVKNCDELFRLNGVQWSGLDGNGGEFAAIVVNPTLMRDFELEKFMAGDDKILGKKNNTQI